MQLFFINIFIGFSLLLLHSGWSWKFGFCFLLSFPIFLLVIIV
uniref:Uncharacterized protein n=1 Tax=Rhizophora mucronata TaxID=61149 RepID=A0A2P2QKM3_RHIMU